MASGVKINYSYTDVPTLARFAASNAFIRGILGPFRSGKSSCCVIEILKRGIEQRRSPDGIRRTRWVVVRNTTPQLEDTTIRTFHMWAPPQHFGRYYESDHTYIIKAFDGCEIEIMFRALDRPEHVRNLLSLEVTGAWVNEAREVPWPIIETLQGRVGQFPPKAMNGPSWQGLFMDTNPPDVDSKWYKFFEETKHDPTFAEIFRQPSGLGPDAENLSNLTSPNYYKLLANGKSDEWVKVYIRGEYGFVIDGRPVYTDYKDSTHCHAVEPMAGLTVYRGWDFGLCYDDQTEVLTDNGWKFFRDVDKEVDRAATRDPATGEMSYAPIAFKIEKDYDGEMLEWSNTELNLCVTPEHRVPFTYRDSPKNIHWESAEWLANHMGGHHYVDLVSEWTGEPKSRMLGFGGLDEPMVFAEFMGLYLAEGSTDKGRVTIYQATQRPDMQRILDATGFPWKWVKTPKATGWRVYDPGLAAFLRQYGKAKQKFAPFAVQLMPPRHIRAFINAYTMGDGHIRKRKNGAVEHTVFTTSKRMAGDFQELAQKAGWNSSLRIVKPQTSVLDGRKITNDGGYSVTFKKAATRAELLKRNFKRVQYKGKVYCLNVPFHTLYVRRKGKPSWNGNTPACVFTQLLPGGRWLVFDEYIAEKTMGADRFSDEVLEHCSTAFPRGAEFIDYGDPAGNSRAQTDEKTCFQILQTKGIDIEPGEQTLSMRLESVRKPLRTMADGEPRFILHPRCKTLRKGFQGGYQFRRLQTAAERYTSLPDKNSYSHPHDALQYIATRLFGGGLTTRREDNMDEKSGLSYYSGDDRGRSAITGY